MILRLFIIFLFMLLSACTTIYHNEIEDDPNWAPSYPVDETLQINNSGAIYNVATVRMLFQDKKALRVGDIITVVLTENTRASKNADTELKKDTDISSTTPNFGGHTPNMDVTLSSANAFKAEADSEQSNLLQGTISVTVQKVFTNGNLFIKGEKWISLNQGSEFIRLSGLIRPQDISKDNQVESTKVANARIYYGGTGPLAEVNEEGWASRFFNSGWWPF